MKDKLCARLSAVIQLIFIPFCKTSFPPIHQELRFPPQLDGGAGHIPPPSMRPLGSRTNALLFGAPGFYYLVTKKAPVFTQQARCAPIIHHSLSSACRGERRELLSAFGAPSVSARNLELMAEDMEARFSLSYTDYKKGGAEMIYLLLNGSVPHATFS